LFPPRSDVKKTYFPSGRLQIGFEFLLPNVRRWSVPPADMSYVETIPSSVVTASLFPSGDTCGKEYGAGRTGSACALPVARSTRANVDREREVSETPAMHASLRLFAKENCPTPVCPPIPRIMPSIKGIGPPFGCNFSRSNG